MKSLIFSLALVAFSVGYAQQNTYKVIIDGKEVLMNIETDGIVDNKETQQVANSNYFNNPIHKVVKGDTYYSIARQHKITVEKLYELNAITKDNVLSIDTSLFINEKVTKSTNDKTKFYHIVNKGDTLYNIAKRYKTSVEELIYINNLSSNIIRLKQRLRIK